jgi:trimeric autotransporter adhesin
VRLVFVNKARRLVGLIALLFFALPFGLSVTGCGHKTAPVVFCNAGDSGPIVGQVATLTLSPNLATTGESLNYGQIGTALSTSAEDCKGNAVSVKNITYASTSSFSENSSGGTIIADINPSNGTVCGGTWNRNSSGGVANFTTCTPPSGTPTTFVAFVTATANGTVSNEIPIYVHPVVTGVVLGGATPEAVNGSCPLGTVDPGSDCCPNNTVGTSIVAPVYTGAPSASFPLGCASQTKVGQLVARVYANGNTNPANNITCEVGHLTFAPSTTSIVSIDENGAATAGMPGSTIITATISQSSTALSAGYFSTCPPASITLQDPTSSSNSIQVAINTPQPLTATVLDTNGFPISGLSLEFNSTTPQTIVPATGSVTPAFPGSANITAVCQPSSCNPAPFSQVGLYGNGLPITSNPITINAVGTSSTVLYMASTSSEYVAFRDFTTNNPSALVKLPYVPNSMVMNQAGTEIYFGSIEGLMSMSATTNAFGSFVQTLPGTVLAVSPDGTTIVVTDSNLQTISLVSASTFAVTTSYGGVGTSASWSPDTQTVYVTTQSGAVLAHSQFTDWQVANPQTVAETYTDAAVAIPSIGAFFAGPKTLDARSYCPSSTVVPSATPPNTITNQFLPLVGQAVAVTDHIAATTNGAHIIGAHAVPGGTSTLSDIDVILPTTTGTGTGAGAACPAIFPTDYFQTSFSGAQNLTGVNAGAITGVFPSSNSDAVFVTYTAPTANPVTNALLPFYIPPATTGQGTLQFLTLGNEASANAAPVAGVFSTDNFTFYVGTAGNPSSDTATADNDVHLITLTYPTGGGSATATETGIISPELPLVSGAAGYAPVNLIAQHPKKTTN